MHELFFISIIEDYREVVIPLMAFFTLLMVAALYLIYRFAEFSKFWKLGALSFFIYIPVVSSDYGTIYCGPGDIHAAQLRQVAERLKSGFERFMATHEKCPSSVEEVFADRPVSEKLKAYFAEDVYKREDKLRIVPKSDGCLLLSVGPNAVFGDEYFDVFTQKSPHSEVDDGWFNVYSRDIIFYLAPPPKNIDYDVGAFYAFGAPSK